VFSLACAHTEVTGSTLTVRLTGGPLLRLCERVDGSPLGLTETVASTRLALEGGNRLVGDVGRSGTGRTATVRRRACAAARTISREVPVEDLVVGDVVCLATGDLVPADLRLFVADQLVTDRPTSGGIGVCRAGRLVTGGSASGIVIATGGEVVRAIRTSQGDFRLQATGELGSR
jgi:hypothetical protein